MPSKPIWMITSLRNGCSFFSSAAHPAVTTGHGGAAGWHCWEWHSVYIDGSGRAGVGSQQQVLLYIQYHFVLFEWLLLELCAFHSSENEAQKVLHHTIVRWGSQDQWMRVFMLLPPRWSWLSHFSFDWVCRFPLICFFPMPSLFLRYTSLLIPEVWSSRQMTS